MTLKNLQIETTNYCNAKCIFCPHHAIKEHGTMTAKLFRKILTDALEVPTIKAIIPMLTGEPFMDPDIIKRLKLINELHPQTIIPLFTNISLLNKKLIKQLARINNLEMFFSLNAHSSITRERITGLNDYGHALEIIELYELFGKPFKVTMIRHPTIHPKEIERFKQDWGEHALVCRFKNFAGQTFKATPNHDCNRAKHEMTILWNGKVNLCCMDALGTTIFGDTNTQTIKQVWKSKPRQKYVQAHTKHWRIKNSLCENCTGA